MNIQYIIIFFSLLLGFAVGSITLLCIIKKLNHYKNKKTVRIKTASNNDLELKPAEIAGKGEITLKDRMREHGTSYLENQCKGLGEDVRTAILKSRKNEDWNFTGMKRTMDKQKIGQEQDSSN